MDSNDCPAALGQVQMSGQVIDGEAVPAGGMEGGDWRTQLQHDSRVKIVNKIMKTLKRHLPFSSQEGLQELKKIAVRFEEKIYAAATSQSDYLRKTSLKMLTMETKSQNPMVNTLQFNDASNSQTPQDPASFQSLQFQKQNQVHQLPITMVPNQSQVQQQLLSQKFPNSTPSTGIPNSAGLTSALPSAGGMSQSTMPNAHVQYPNMLNLYNQWQQQLLMQQKFGQGGVPQSIMQSQMQQQQQQQQLQKLLQLNQLQSSQPAVMQSSLSQATASSTLQNQETSLQKSTQSSMPQHPMLPTQQNQMITQQNNMQTLMALRAINQKNLSGQQNNLPNMHQQQLGCQTNLPGFQQQKMVGIQHGNSSLQTTQQPVHMLQQSMVAVQQQMQQNMANMLPNLAQLSLSQPMQQQLMSQIPSQLGLLKQQLDEQQQANILPRESGPMLQQQTTIDLQKQVLQSQRVMPEVPQTSLDSSSQTGSASDGDWQEEIYQKLKSMHEMYYPELNEMYQQMVAKLQQHDAHPQQPKNEQLEKLRFLKLMLERLILFLRTNKSDIQPNHKEKIVGVEKQIVNILNSNRPRKPVSSLQQGQLTQPHMHAMQHPQMNSRMQPMNIQGSMMPTEQSNLTNLPHNSLSSGSSVSNSQKNILYGLQPGANIDPGQGNALNQMQQVAMPSLQQNGLTALQSNVNSLQSNSNIFQPQQVYQQYLMQQQYIQRLFMQQQLQYMRRQQLIQPLNIPTLHTKTGTPLQSANLPFVVPSPSTSMAPSPMPGDSEKTNSGMHHSTTEVPMANQSLAIGTPWISASPLLAEFTSPDGTHGVAPTIVSGNTNVMEQPLKRFKVANHAVEEELPEIKQRLLDTVVYVSEDDVDRTAVAAATEAGEGTIVKCFSAVVLIILVFWMMLLWVEILLT